MTVPERLALARKCLLGLSIGDAFGETFFGKEELVIHRINNQQLQPGEWLFTDDTVMAIGIYNILKQYGAIDQDKLAIEFAGNYNIDTYRGYGGTAHSILRSIGEGKHWKPVAQSVFDGMGSMGNGAAMRAGITGAYFCDDLQQVIQQTTLTAEVTHSNHEAIAGAIAIALAASFAARPAMHEQRDPVTAFFNFIIEHTPASAVQARIAKAATLPKAYDIRTIVSILGNGIQLTAQDTVPFALWCAAHHLHNFESALWTAVSGLGDRDTICAMTGSIVVLSAESDTLPRQWVDQTEKVHFSPFFK